jgi:hypothetical protein
MRIPSRTCPRRTTTKATGPAVQLGYILVVITLLSLGTGCSFHTVRNVIDNPPRHCTLAWLWSTEQSVGSVCSTTRSKATCAGRKSTRHFSPAPRSVSLEQLSAYPPMGTPLLELDTRHQMAYGRTTRSDADFILDCPR